MKQKTFRKFIIPIKINLFISFQSNFNYISNENMDLISMCPDIDNCLEQLQFDDHLAVGVSREYVKNNHLFANEQLFCFDEKNHIESDQITVLVYRDKNLINLFNNEIRKFSEAGLISKWIKDYRKPKATIHFPTFTYYSLWHAQAVFVFGYGILLSFAILALTGEFLTYNKHYLLVKLRLLKLCELFVDPDRFPF